jgi:type I restriction enzyme S subunit
MPFPDAIDFQEGPGILAKDFRPTGIPLVRLAGLARGASVLDGCNHLDPEMVERRWPHFKLQVGDVLLSTSASLGRIAVVTRDAEGAVAYTGIIRMRPRAPEVLQAFIPYLLESKDFQNQAEGMGAGSVIRHFGPMHLKQMRVTIPPGEVQKAIIGILSAYDDLIKNNQRRIQILDQMARALYREWFVEFRFPGHEKKTRAASPLGDIPIGWTIAPLDTVKPDQPYAINGGPFGSKLGTRDYVADGVP